MAGTKTNNPVPNFYRASEEDFRKIPGRTIAYWISDQTRSVFESGTELSKIFSPKKGLTTGDNEQFIRRWYEIDVSQFSFFSDSNPKWYPMTKGGDFRKWYGNNEYVINWAKDGEKLSNFSGSVIRNKQYYFLEGASWNDVSAGLFSIRYIPKGFINNAVGPMMYGIKIPIENVIALLNSKIGDHYFKFLCPTMKFEIGDISKFPILKTEIITDIQQLISLSKNDWDSYETSWDFTTLPLISPDYLTPTIEASYQKLWTHWHEMTREMQSLEEENNNIFIEAYGLQDELTPDVPLSEITLTCNPYYRYDANKPEEELESLLRTDTIKELISYAVGCMVGRYSLDTPGLILANQGETVDDYLSQISQPSFRPDDDNIIPVLDDEYFTDDIVFRFKDFLKTVFGEKTLSQNLDYIAQALTGKSTSSPEKVIRDYFLKDFFKDHVQRYKKRPIYWMFSSGKQQGFNALVYMHRYNKTTLAKMRTDYLLELEAKLDAELTALNEDPVKNKARISKIKKQVEEMKTWDELLNNKALALIEIDLDDGVVVNYAKFEGLVRAI